jgi:Domain of unknown function (DUF4326)
VISGKKKLTLEDTWELAVYNRNRSGYVVLVKRWESEDELVIDFLRAFHCTEKESVNLLKIYSLRSAAQQRDPIPPDAVYVGRGRGSQWGNPYMAHSEADRDDVCDRFEQYAQQRLEREPHWLEPLRDRSLVCWCQSPSDRNPKRCHAMTLLRLANPT